jgi:hypothetical protein
VLLRLKTPRPRLLLVPTGPGTARDVAVGDLAVAGAAWLPDGKRIFLRATPPGGGVTRGYLMDLPEGRPRPFGPESPQWAVFSPDSRLALIGRPDGQQLVYPTDGGEPFHVPGLSEDEKDNFLVPAGSFTGDGRGVYLVHFRDFPPAVDRIELESGRREPWKELVPADRAGVMRITDYMIGADDRSYAYSVSRTVGGAIYVIEGLR